MFTDNGICFIKQSYIRSGIMKNIQILLNDDEYAVVVAAAEKQGVPVLVYIRSLLLGEEDAFAAIYAETLRRVEALAPKTEFNLKTLFGTDWTMSRGTKLTLGKAFYDMVDGGKVPTAKALGKDSSNIMQYVRV